MTVVGEGGDFDADGIPDVPVGMPELDTVVIVSGRQAGARLSRGRWAVVRTLRCPEPR